MRRSLLARTSLLAGLLAHAAPDAFAQGTFPEGASPVLQTLELTDPDILPAGARLEVLYDGAFFSEGPAVAPDNRVYFSDITFTHVSGDPPQAGHIMRYDPETGRTEVFRSPSGMSNGLKFDARGRLIACEGADHGGRRVTRTDMATGKSVILASHYNGYRLNAPNDLSIDEKGRIYFSDPKYLGHEPMEQEVFGVYRIDPDGSITRIITDAGKPTASPCRRTRRASTSSPTTTAAPPSTAFRRAPRRRPRAAWPCWPTTWPRTAPPPSARCWSTTPPRDGPDGLVCDVEGNLYVAVRDMTRPGIYVYSPEGQERAWIPTPTLPTNVGSAAASGPAPST